MNALEAHNQAAANVNGIYNIHRSNDVKTMQHLEMVEDKQDSSKQITISEAIEDIAVGNYVKGTVIDMMA